MGLPSQIATPGGKLLSVNADDVLWLSRAVEAEGAPRDLVAQTLVNRWAWLSDRGSSYPTLTSLVRAYAQPVNPRWYSTGDLHQARLARATEAEVPGLIAAAERREHGHSTRVAFSPETQRAVKQALFTGPITLPPGALHFAAAYVSRPDLPILVPGVPGRSNTIFGERAGQGAGKLYAFATPGPTFPRAQLLSQRPHAVLAFLFLTGGALLGLKALGGRRK